MGDPLAVRAHVDGGTDAIVVTDGDRSIGDRLVNTSGKYRLVCAIFSDLNSFLQRRYSSHNKRLLKTDDSGYLIQGLRTEEEGDPSRLNKELKRIDEIISDVYNSLPEDAMLIVSVQGVTSNDSEDVVVDADHAAVLMGIKHS